MPAKARSLADRLWEKVDRGDGGGCWVFTGATQAQGYGVLFVSKKPSRMGLAHRIAYQVSVGEMPPELDVLHRCDNRRCVRPDHLFLGTQEENNRDMARKGRAAKGEAHFRAKLWAGAVREIRAAHGAGAATPHQLAARFKVSPATIYQVVNGATWRHVTNEPGEV